MNLNGTASHEGIKNDAKTAKELTAWVIVDLWSNKFIAWGGDHLGRPLEENIFSIPPRNPRSGNNSGEE